MRAKVTTFLEFLAKKAFRTNRYTIKESTLQLPFGAC